MQQDRSKKATLFPHVLVLIVAGLINVTIAFLSITGTISLGNQGVSMDTQGNIYVGKDRQILVYDLSGDPLRTISPHTERGYCFQITEDVLYVSAEGRILTMDLAGAVLEETTGSQRIPIVRRATYTVGGRTFDVTRNELYYSVKEQLPSGPRTILHETAGNVFLQILMLAGILTLLASILCLVLALRRRQKARTGHT